MGDHHDHDDYNPVRADDSESIVLLDTVNAFFSMYHQSLRRFNRAHHRERGSTVDADDAHGLSALKSAFEATFLRGIRNILNRTGADSRDLVFAIDCQRRNVWRHDLLTDRETNQSRYKATRPQRSDAGIPAVLRFLYDDLLPRALPGRRVGAPRAEADDVIAVIARLVNARAPDRRVYVVSDDSDFVQLLDHPSTELLNQRLNRMRTKYPRPAREYLAMKIYMGDRIDNIQGAFPRVGPKTADALVRDPALLAAKIERYGRRNLERNRRLICFDYIPDDIRSRIIERALLLRPKPPRPRPRPGVTRSVGTATTAATAVTATAADGSPPEPSPSSSSTTSSPSSYRGSPLLRRRSVVSPSPAVTINTTTTTTTTAAPAPAILT